MKLFTTILICLLFSGANLFAGAEIQDRSKVAEKDKWKLEDIYASDDAWENDFKLLQTEIPTFSEFTGRLDESGKTLLNFIQSSHKASGKLGILYAYAHMRNDEDKSNSNYQEIYDRISSLASVFAQSVAFFEPELLSIDNVRFDQLLEEEKGLELYAQFFDNIRRAKAHTLSAKEEGILAQAGELARGPGNIFGVWNSVDIQFPKIKDENGKEVQLSKGLYGKYQQVSDRELRKNSYLGLYEPYIANRNTLAATYTANVKTHVFYSRVKNYSSSLESALDANNIPVSVYTTLLDTVHENLAPLHRYVALRKKILGLKDGVHDYDLIAPLFPSQTREIPWDEAKSMCLDGLQAMGDDYIKVLAKGFNERWIDVYETKGKRGGAYSSGAYGIHPYVLMNYNGTLYDTFTLAHEMGHALHTYYTQETQPYVYGDYPIFLAEVASTASEAILQDYLLKKATSKEEKLGLLNAFLDNYSRTFFRQAVFAEFELKSHQMVERGEALTADKMDKLFGEIYSKTYGPDFVLDRECSALWSRIPHFYYNFYVFQYSTSFVASKALASKILEEGAPAQERFLKFLKSGNTKYAIDTLKIAGVDMTTKEPVVRTIQTMDKLLDEFEKLL